jgi:alkylhydroperoxidase family enzyme
MRSTILLTALTMFTSTGSVPAAPGEAEDRFALESDEECWRKLPLTEQGGGQPLPSWARALTGLMPRTTAVMLQLDHVHRTQSPLDGQLRARMRWVGAHANRCAYAEAYALYDARRAGLSDEDLKELARGDESRRSAGEKAALTFARKMTVDSASVTDEEFATLVREYGQQGTAAMVLLMAYANFQDRLLLCLGSRLEPDGPRPPLKVVFAPGAFRSQPAGSLAGPVFLFDPATDRPQHEADPGWASLTYEQLQARLDSQRRRQTRLPVPSWEEVQHGLPQGFMPPNRVVWNLVHLGYAPELAVTWETLMRANAPETNAHLDRVFGVELFWVATRASNCPYCMGHTQMLWELGGLDQARIEKVCRVLASSDWSSFPPAQRRALDLARIIAQEPWSVTTEDILGLKHDFGAVPAAVIIWWNCRANYMTRVANGFQLSLEPDNVLREYILNPQPRPAGGQGRTGR